MSDNEEEMDLEYLEVARAKDMDAMFHISLLSFGLGVVFYTTQTTNLLSTSNTVETRNKSFNDKFLLLHLNP
jgi:uncharacterized protein (DUF2164 family)